ncbi:MAG: SDR family oxidoreductase, partial [Bacteroidota bacterium]
MKILITGSNGLLGQKLVHLLRKEESIDLVATSQGENRISEQRGYIYESLDISNFEEVNTLLLKHKPDTVINTAAMTQVDLCEDLPEKCRLLNVAAVGYLTATCKEINAHFIQLSTDFVFDGKEGPYREEDTPNPLSYYAVSKYDSEKLVQNAGLNKWSIVRTIIIYGVAEKMSRSNIVLWAMDALQKQEALKIVDDQFRAPTLAEDLADGCIEIAKKGANGIFHLSGPESMSILECVHRIALNFNWSADTVEAISTESLNKKAKRPPRTGFI